jgi:hypothetical protein
MNSFRNFKFLVGKMVHILKWEFRDVTHDGHKLNKVTKMKFAALRVIGQQKIWFFWLFGGSRYESRKQTKRHTSIPHGKPKIWYHLIVEWVPIFWEVWGKSICGDLDVDDEGSEQCRFEPVQSLHHGSVGYQPVRTQIDLTKKAISLQKNREHKKEQERSILNCTWMISSRKLSSYKLNIGKTVLDRLI